MKKIIAVLTITFLSSTSLANASETMLREFFNEVMHLSADFTQRVEDERGSLLELSSGRFYLSRPGKFRWDYQNPDFADESGQQIVADGENLFFYDPDLEQVSQRSLEAALAQVPSLLLVQQGGDVDKHFSIVDYGVTDGLSWVALKPKDADAAYSQLLIGFAGNTISSLLLYDGLGNSTRLELSNVDSTVELDSKVFTFEVPEGADLLRE